MDRTRIKICGITRIEDAQAAATAGADAIGLVFYPKSPRVVTIEQAKQIVKSLPAFVTVVGLFVNEDPQVVFGILEQVSIGLLQFHGDEPQEYCEQFKRPYIKAIRVKADTDVLAEIKKFESATSILLDTFNQDLQGGTGEIFDWNIIPRHCAKPLILAGGLTSNNVGQAITQIKPYAVDVSGGVEKAKGLKDFEKIKQFISEVNRVDIGY